MWYVSLKNMAVSVSLNNKKQDVSTNHVLKTSGRFVMWDQLGGVQIFFP